MENSIKSIMEYLCATLAFEKITFSKCRDKTVLRASAVPFSRRGDDYIQIETRMQDGKALHRNLPAKEAAEVLCTLAQRQYRQTDIKTENGSCEIRFSKKDQCGIINKIKPVGMEIPKTETPDAVDYGAAGSAAAGSAAEGFAVENSLLDGQPVLRRIKPPPHNKQKRYLLEGEHGETPAFLYPLGITDEHGRILDKKRPKYRQINRFLELLDDVYDRLPKVDPLVVYDFCCGKSYLTFAVYHYFTKIKGRSIKLHGVDRKPDVIAYCNETAAELGMQGMTFYAGDINAFVCPPGETPHLVLSLHACDIATDIVLKNAVRLGAGIVLSTPCCHHKVFGNMHAPELSFITRHSMLGQKLAEAATDGLRCLWMELQDYDVQTMELIDPEETPKNMMIRAVKRKIPRTEKEKTKLQKEYDAACAMIGFVPYLGREGDVPPSDAVENRETGMQE
ncbi:MAG: SAM-dependent methyltransferase [Clostridia bacterium]|nr:SAM-dependent methyltransferase [Clostridia bacterium]